MTISRHALRQIVPGPFMVRLRRAVLEDLPILLQWDDDDDVGFSSGDDDVFDWAYELPRDVPWRELLMAELDGRPIGFVQIIDAREEETHYWGDTPAGIKAIDIWIGDAADRSQGHGAAMMRLAFARCFADPATHTILIDPLVRNVRAIRFYLRLGFEMVGPRRFGDDDCLVLSLRRARWSEMRAP